MSEQKYYQLGTYTQQQWHEIHKELGRDAEGTVPRCVSCIDEKHHSSTRGTYLLTDEEAESLKQDNRIKFIQTDPEHYIDEYHIPEDELKMDLSVDRYSNPVKNYHFWANSGGIRSDFDSSATSLNRATSQLLRLQQKSNPWLATDSSSTVIEDTPAQRFTGKDVDVICADNGTWIGHAEFINRDVVNAVNPQNYIGGNPLPGNGYCDVLDIILDGPYYLDPDWFNADSDNRLETRWDGTIVPTEQAARDWWGNESNRSTGFEFGNILINTDYTRNRQHGSNTTFPTLASADHGTQCASLLYGRTHGWAYNANKWHLNLYGSGSNSIQKGFDVQKIFHQYKPVNSAYGNKNPTISSNSWGFRANKPGAYYYWRNDGPIAYNGTSDEPEFIRYMGIDGDGGRWASEHDATVETVAGDELISAGVICVVASGNSAQQQVSPDHPNFDNFIAQSNTADVNQYNYEEFGRPTKGTTNRRGFPGHIGQTDNYEYPAIAVGALDDVFGSYNGKIKERKVNYSNMGNSIDIYAPADGTLAATVGDYGTSISRYDDSYPDLSVSGILNSSIDFSGVPEKFVQFTITVDGVDLGVTFLNNEVEFQNLSDTDLDIDIDYTLTGEFTSGFQTITGFAVTGSFVNPDDLQPGETISTSYDDSFLSTLGSLMSITFVEITGTIYYTGQSNRVNDTRFSGTSAACPVACGLIATWLEKNRSWDYREIREYIQKELEIQDSSNFHVGTEASGPNDTEWQDRTNIQSSQAKVIYEGSVSLIPLGKITKSGSFIFKGNMSISLK